MLHFATIQRTITTPHDYKIFDAFLSREIYSGEFELFTRPSKSDFLRDCYFFGIIKKIYHKTKKVPSDRTTDMNLLISMVQ